MRSRRILGRRVVSLDHWRLRMEQKYHALSRPGQKHAIGILAVDAFLGAFDGAPPRWSAVSKDAKLPALVAIPDEVAAPAKADPIQFEPLNLELRGKDFAAIAGANIGLVREIPMLPWILGMKGGTRLKALCPDTSGAGRANQPMAISPFRCYSGVSPASHARERVGNLLDLRAAAFSVPIQQEVHPCRKLFCTQTSIRSAQMKGRIRLDLFLYPDSRRGDDQLSTRRLREPPVTHK